jgi:hypothetical protein
MHSWTERQRCRFCAMTNLDPIPTPGPDCTDWRNVSPVGHGPYRQFEPIGGRHGDEFAHF